nr:hypothetical protein [Tanacetum cinerariifolium]
MVIKFCRRASKTAAGYEPHMYKSKLLFELDRIRKIIDERVLHDEELWMKEREVKAIRINKALERNDLNMDASTKEILMKLFTYDLELL